MLGAWWFGAGFVAGVMATIVASALCAHAVAVRQAEQLNAQHQKWCAAMQAEFDEIKNRK